MSTPEKTTTMQSDLTCLRSGDKVEVRQLGGPGILLGEVDIAVPQQGFLWIRHGRLKERKLLLASEHDIRVTPSQEFGQSTTTGL